MAEKHTPGDWRPWQSPSGEWTVRTWYTDERGRRCTAWPAVCDAGGQDNEANARLMAAAPKLLEALEWAEYALGNLVKPESVSGPDDTKAWAEHWLLDARKAIAAAKNGESDGHPEA
jgi:hypothetical protein